MSRVKRGVPLTPSIENLQGRQGFLWLSPQEQTIRARQAAVEKGVQYASATASARSAPSARSGSTHHAAIRPFSA